MTLQRPHLADLETLQWEAWRLLCRIDAQLSETPAMPIGRSVSTGKPGSRPPRALDEEPALDHWRRRFADAWDDIARLRPLVLACDASIHRELGTLQAWLKEHGEHAAAYKLTGDREASLSRIVELWPSLGWPAEDVAQVETVLRGGVSTRSVRWTWREHGLDPHTGERLPEGPPADKRAQVAELRAAGVPFREIERRTGVASSTAQRWFPEETAA